MHQSPESTQHKEPLWKRESKAASNVKRNEATPKCRRYRKRRAKDKILPSRARGSLGGPKEPAFMSK